MDRDRDRDRDRDKDRNRYKDRYRTYHLISVPELVYLHTKSTIDLILLLVPFLLFRFLSVRLKGMGATIPNLLHDIRRNSH